MRRLNQVLAGHLSFAEVPRVHEPRDSFDALSAAPSHGSAAHYSPRESPLDDRDDAKIDVERLSARQAALRQVVRRVLHMIEVANFWLKSFLGGAGGGLTQNRRENRSCVTTCFVVHLGHHGIVHWVLYVALLIFLKTKPFLGDLLLFNTIERSSSEQPQKNAYE